MGKVVALRPLAARDSHGRIRILEGQRWFEKKYPDRVWIVSFVEVIQHDDNEKMKIYLVNSDGEEALNTYSESYFRRWFCEVTERTAKENLVRNKTKKVRNLKHWQTDGLVVRGSSSKKQ